MEFLYCFDENFCRVAVVSILSLAKNNSNAVIHIFMPSCSDSSLQKMTDLVSPYGVKLRFYFIEDDLNEYRNIFAKRKINALTFGRLLAAKYINSDVDKLLYIDADTLILSSLEELETLDMSDYYIAGVYDMSLPALGVKEQLGFNTNDLYINAGITYINLEKWRNDNLTDRFFRFCEQHPDTIFYDQDALNYVCKDKVLLLPPKYNMLFITSELPYNSAIKMLDKNTFDFYSRNAFEESQKNPTIIHFASELFGKPWLKGSCIKYKDEWREIDKLTPWGGLPYANRVFSYNKFIAAYKIICEKAVSFFYVRRMYRMTTFMYNVLFRDAHKLQTLLKK